MADLANLKIAVDSTEVRKGEAALDGFSTSAKTSTSSIDRLYESQRRLDKAYASSNREVIEATKYLNNMQRELTQVGKSALQIKAIEVRMAAARAPTEELAQQIRSVGAEMIRAERNSMRSGKGIENLGKGSRLAAHHSQNLAFQIQDIAVSLQAGQNPLTVFMQQGSQIGGIAMQAGLGIGGMTRAIIGMTAAAAAAVLLNPVFLGIAATVAVVSAALSFMASDISKTSGVSVTAVDVMLGAFDVLSDMVSDGITAAFAYFGATTGEVWETIVNITRRAVNIIIGIVSLIPRAFVEAFQVVPGIIEKLLSGDFSGAVNAATSSIGKLAGETFSRDYIGQIGTTLSGAAVNRALERKAKEGGKKVGKSLGAGVKEGIDEELKAAQAFVKSLEDEIAKFGKTAEELRRAEVDAAVTAASRFDAEAQKIRVLGDVREALLNVAKAEEVLKAAQQTEGDIRKRNELLKHQIGLIGLVGNARDEAVRAFEDEAVVAEMAAKGIHRGNDALEEYLRLRRELAQGESAFAKDAEAANRVANNLEAAAGMLGQGKGASVVQNALRLEFEVGKGDNKETKKLSQILSKELDKVAKGFGEKLGQAFAGAKIGEQVDGVFKAIGIKSSKTGAQIGGGIGGAFGGPLGALAGSIVGGLVGGMLKKTKRASATIEIAGGNALVAGVTGTNSKLRGVATGLANGLIKGLTDVAEQLGGALGGATSLSIGQRKDKFTVDVTGRGRTKGVPSFATEAEAIAYAMQYAIGQGAITGISAGAQALIRGSGDLNVQLQKALTFDNVFKELAREKDPLTASLDELGRDLAGLEALFREAGAGAAEYAQLQELFAIRRQRAITEAERPAREKEIELLEAQGRTVEALAARRNFELDAMDASLRSIQRMIFAQEDLNAAVEAQAEAISALADARANEQSAIENLRSAISLLNDDVTQAQARLDEAISAQRQRDIEGMQQQVAAFEAVIAQRSNAEAALRRSYDAEVARIRNEITLREQNIAALEAAFNDQSRVFTDAAKGFRVFAQSLREFADTIIPMNAGGRASLETLRRRFAEISALAIGGDVTAQGQVTESGSQLRDSIIANASDSVSMLRDLNQLRAQTLAVADASDLRASVEDSQLEALRQQNDMMILAERNANAAAEAQIEALTEQVGQLIALNENILSVADAIKQLETATSAALNANLQRVQLEAQIAALVALDEEIVSVEQAQRELAEAQATRDQSLFEVTRAGFESLLTAAQESNAQNVSAALAAAQDAAAIVAQAQASLTVAQAAAAAAAQASAAEIAAVATIQSAADRAADVAQATAIAAAAIAPDFSRSVQLLVENIRGGGGGNSANPFERTVNAFANGGMHSGGLRIVGENGPELEATGPSRIYNANQLGGMMGGSDAAEEIKSLRQELKSAMYQIAKNTGKSYDLLDRWDGDGLPETRVLT